MSTPTPPFPLHRRTALGAAAWTAPVIAVAAAAPAYAATATTFVRTVPATEDFSEDTTTVARAVSATLRDGTTPVAGETVAFTLSDTTWLRFAGGATSASTTTNTAGLATTSLTVVPGATPTPGFQVVLTATSRGLRVAWTVTYRPYEAIAGARLHALGLAGGLVCAWGRGDQGQLGNGSTNNSSVPTAVQTVGTPMAGRTITAVAGGENHSLALDSAGLLYAWGRGAEGQLGTGGTDASLVPVAVTPAGGGFTAIAAGFGHCVALGKDNKVYAWGRNSRGEAGTGSTSTGVSAPARVVGLPDAVFTAVAAGGEFSLALTEDGTVYAWGSGGLGQLGNGASGTSALPVQVSGTGPGGTAMDLVAAGGTGNHALARAATSGTVWAWGDNSFGQLGNGTGGAGSSSNVPVAVTSTGALAGRTVVALAVGAAHSLALDSAGTAYAWGSDVGGTLGDGSPEAPSAVPVTVTPVAGTTFTAVSASSVNSYALTGKRLGYSWGRADFGGLGTGSGNALSPVEVDVAP